MYTESRHLLHEAWISLYTICLLVKFNHLGLVHDFIVVLWLCGRN